MYIFAAQNRIYKQHYSYEKNIFITHHHLYRTDTKSIDDSSGDAARIHSGSTLYPVERRTAAVFLHFATELVP
jgi:hypothetical protein